MPKSALMVLISRCAPSALSFPCANAVLMRSSSPEGWIGTQRSRGNDIRSTVLFFESTRATMIVSDRCPDSCTPWALRNAEEFLSDFETVERLSEPTIRKFCTPPDDEARSSESRWIWL